MGWIGIAGGNAMGKGPESPYTPAEYDTVLQFFQSNQGSFFTVAKIAQLNSLPVSTTQDIVEAQVADSSTGVIEQKGEYGIPKKEEKKSKK
tara:strand:+ start:1323 stop:1595 length:273 start_codon:yes stop_codon:yes gene_type:complete